jgi:hypothetical protein
MHPPASAGNDSQLLSRVESLLDDLVDASKIRRKKSVVKRELCRDFVSVIRGVRPAFMLDYAPLMTAEEVKLISDELNENVLKVDLTGSSERGGERGGEGMLLKVCTVLDTVVLVTLGEEEEEEEESLLQKATKVPIMVDLDQEISRARRLEASELAIMTACRAKMKSNLGSNIDERDLGDGAIPPQTFVGWMLGYPILYYYGSKKNSESENGKEESANVAARKLSLCSLVKVECINDKNEVMYGFTYPESVNEDALIKEALKSWMDGIEKQGEIGLSVRVTHRGPSPVAL